MKKSTVLLGLALSLGLSSTHAAIDTIDAVPAATLLLPHFEVDPGASGIRTVFTVGNISDLPVLAHVTLWTDRGVPSFTFDMRLDGYGVVEVDLHALFADGALPQTSAGAFPSCAGVLPPANLSGAQVTGLRNAHTGLASSLLGNQCGGATHGDSIARGYATIDVVNACTQLRPSQPGYFVLGGNGVARNDNVLWGEHSTYDPVEGFAHGDSLVHIEASSAHPATDGTPSPDNDYTFYGRLLGGNGADNREGLPQHWMGRFASRGIIDQTIATVWRDPGFIAPFACASPPAGLPSGVIVAFDQQEQPTTNLAVSPVPLASQRNDLTSPAQPQVPFDSGFVQYDLRISDGDALFGGKNQAHVGQVFRSVYGGSAGQASAWPLHPITTSYTPFFSSFACSDGIDNDSDGLIDFPDDPGCAGPQSPTENPACGDGMDNDGDLLVDFPSDPECGTATDNSEDFIGACDDGVDNDFDGLIDFPIDPGCNHPLDATEYRGLCDDGIDNDGDNLIDFPADPGCSGFFDNDEANPACSDGIDNDGDSLIDFPADPGCASLSGNIENPVCNDGVDNDGDSLIDFPQDPSCTAAFSTSESTQCSDNIDNDGDSLIDFPADPGCTAFDDQLELDFQCNDGIDNDSNGLIDYPLDTGCTTAQDESEGPDCSDAEDNDFDGLADFGADPGCASAADLNELANATTRGCADGIDNDGDGQIDFPADEGCISAWDDVEFAPPFLIFGDGFEAQAEL